MYIEIYKNGEDNPIIINYWEEFFKYFPEIPENAAEELEFWNPYDRYTLNPEMVIETLKQVINTKKILEYLNTQEIPALI